MKSHLALVCFLFFTGCDGSQTTECEVAFNRFSGEHFQEWQAAYEKDDLKAADAAITKQKTDMIVEKKCGW